ncbi:Hypothetical predicted protein [Octopus vulgaris]|uniref:Uncharacterized protein n=1 Tax=Octopus vulgaris TaxID=6645 RepID=A0AA36FPA0_OCTVU|nr:Hypothetical predicted protein [Octopus vulgaris]
MVTVSLRTPPYALMDFVLFKKNHIIQHSYLVQQISERNESECKLQLTVKPKRVVALRCPGNFTNSNVEI